MRLEAMSRLVLWTFVACLFLIGSISTADHVIDLDVGNFDTVVSQGDIVVEFYAPGCGHCKKLAPEYEKAAKILKDENSTIRLAKCDVENTGDDRFDVKRFPTIRIFRRGSTDNPTDYKGPRTADGIVAEVKKAFGPASTWIKTKDDAQKLAVHEAVMIGAFGKEGPESKTYLEAAEKLRDEPFLIAHTFNPKLLEPCTADPEYCTGALVFMLKGLEKNISKFNGEFTVKELSEWAIKESVPALTELIQSNPRHMKAVNAMFVKSEPRLIMFVPEEYKNATELKPILIELDKGDDSFNVLYIDASINSKAARFFGLEEKDWPAIVLHDHTGGKKYIQKNIRPADVKAFVAKYKTGELEETIKSEDPPKDDKGPVKRLVGTTFLDVFKLGKDVFLEFYASWCGHCKKLEPIYDQLGKHFKNNENIIIAKIDAAANDIPDKRFAIKGFPTLKYVTKAGDVLDYSGDRTLVEMVKFIEKNINDGSNKDPKAKEEKIEEQGDVGKKVEL